MFLPITIVLFAAYILLLNTDLKAKLFCFFNASMLAVFCPMYTIILMSPAELGNTSGVFMTYSGMISLGLSLIVGAVFFRTLTEKLPMLLNEEHMFIIPLCLTLFMYWMTPNSPEVIMTGRVRNISLLLVLFIPAVMFLFYHAFWRLASRLTEAARELRHNFRQHILVISRLAELNSFGELLEYLSNFTQASPVYTSYCANPAVDAVIAHYDSLAKSKGIAAEWSFRLPALLPMSEADYCAMLGNLVENSMNCSV